MGSYDVKQEVNDKYSLRGRVFNKIREDILSGKYKEHEELREVAIGEELGVSRTPVREAFRQLELEGLIQIVPNKGAYVTGITAKDVEDIYMIRSKLEGLCARWATDHITEEQLEELEENVYLADFHAQKGLLVDFHEYVLRVRRKTLSNGGRGKVSNDEHRQIMEAIKAKDKDRAEILAHEHIVNAYDNMVKNGLYEIYDKAEPE